MNDCLLTECNEPGDKNYNGYCCPKHVAEANRAAKRRKRAAPQEGRVRAAIGALFGVEHEDDEPEPEPVAVVVADGLSPHTRNPDAYTPPGQYHPQVIRQQSLAREHREVVDLTGRVQLTSPYEREPLDPRLTEGMPARVARDLVAKQMWMARKRAELEGQEDDAPEGYRSWAEVAEYSGMTLDEIRRAKGDSSGGNYEAVFLGDNGQPQMWASRLPWNRRNPGPALTEEELYERHLEELGPNETIENVFYRG